MRAIISVIGKDTFGILSKVSSVCFENRANVVDVNQSILQDMFVMVSSILCIESERGTHAEFRRHNGNHKYDPE